MRHLILMLFWVIAFHAHSATTSVLPFPIQQSVLKNGLTVISVPFDSPGIIAYYSIVRTGSRNEIEPGKSGFAHFFEHLMFRGTPTVSGAQFQELLQSYGANANAFTDDDWTAYHITGSKNALADIVRVEADRFKNLSFSESEFQQEAGAVLGEYEKSASHPASLIAETLSEVAFSQHPYGHTTIGYKRDILNMPKEYAYSQTFFKRWYRPDNTIILVVGDIAHDDLVKQVTSRYADWAAGVLTADIPKEPPQKKENRVALTWNGPTQPHLAIAYRVPAFDPQSIETAALDLLSEAAFSSTSPLYQSLVLRENRVSELNAGAPYRRDPQLFSITATLRKKADLKWVEGQIAAALKNIANQGIAPKRLAEIKSHVRYRFAMNLTTPDNVAHQLGMFLQLTGKAQSADQLFQSYERVTSEDIQQVLRTYFVPNNRSLVTLVEGKARARKDLTTAPVKADHTPNLRATAVPEVPLPPASAAHSRSPLVSIRIEFRTGSQNDPADKKGLAHLTAQIMASGGSKTRTYAQVLADLYPTAGTFEVDVDKELTVFSGTVHQDQQEAFLKLFLDQIINPRFAADDFNRLKKNQLVYLTSELRSSMDEQLGKAALELALYPPTHPYGHLVEGTVAGLNSISISDVRRFYQDRFSLRNVLVKTNGGDRPNLVAEIMQALSPLGIGATNTPDLPNASMPSGLEITVIEKETAATAISLGFPMGVTRSDDDFYALALATSALGEHRQFVGRLMRHMRVARGLNYGDYAYAEHFTQDDGTTFALPGTARRQQYFSIWLRPVALKNSVFSLRQAIRELEVFVDQGLSPDEFDKQRKFLVNYSLLWLQTAGRRLGFDLDGIFYGKKSLVEELQSRLPKLSLAEVNSLIKKHFQAKNLSAVLVTSPKAKLMEQLLSKEPSPIEYQSKDIPPSILEEDKLISTYPVKINRERAKTVQAAALFQK